MLARTLKSIRERLGMASARAFYQYIGRKGSLDFNYSYYMKVEKGQVLPSTKVINQISHALPENYGNELVLAYCVENFPKHRQLFHSEYTTPTAPTPAAVAPVNKLQKELTERQVAAICESKEHYFLFLLVVLSRRSLAITELEEKFSTVNNLIEDLAQAKILYQEENQLMSAYTEWKFPAASSQSIKNLYKKLDQYDLEKNSFFGLQKIKNANLFRRISPRYFDLVLQSIDLALQTTRLSDDLDARHNNEIISLHIGLHRGKIPG
jgi:hypothetical protein